MKEREIWQMYWPCTNCKYPNIVPTDAEEWTCGRCGYKFEIRDDEYEDLADLIDAEAIDPYGGL